MEPKIMNLPRFHVVGVTVYGDCSDLFAKAWDMYVRIRKDMKWKNEKVGYGVEFYTEEFQKEKKWFYMACGEVENLDNIPAAMVGKIIPAHTYAVFTHKGLLRDLGKTFHHVYHEWLPKSKYKIADCYDFELYDERFKDGDNPDSEIDIYLPVVEK